MKFVEAIFYFKDGTMVYFIDDDISQQGCFIDGKPIYSPKELREIIVKRNISLILLALPSVSRSRRNEIIKNLNKLKVAVRSIPGISDIANGKSLINADLSKVKLLEARKPQLSNDIKLTIYDKCDPITLTYIPGVTIQLNRDTKLMKLKLGIVGHGFVGSAVDYAFTTEDVKKFIVDPKIDTSIDEVLSLGFLLVVFFLYRVLSSLLTKFLQVLFLSFSFSSIFIGFIKSLFVCGEAPTHQPSNITTSGFVFIFCQNLLESLSSIDLSNFGIKNFLKFLLFKFFKHFNSNVVLCVPGTPLVKKSGFIFFDMNFLSCKVL